MALGGLGAAMFSSSSPLWSIHMALRKVDIQSMFFASMIVIVLVVLAYLTNPSETSFRTYLTEQSFRQHLRRLDDDNAEDSDDDEVNGVHYTLTRRNTTTSSALHKPGRSYSDSHSPFHFVNRASVSLRTPKHVFHSFGVFTIAAIVPNGSQASNTGSTDSPSSFVSDSWYIGAFGRWWRGGYTQRWWLDPIANTADTESCNSGILDLKTLDSLECYDGLPYAVPALPPHLTAKASSSNVRDSARAGHRTANSSGRSSTPPPLPKSASLPLHAPPPSSTPSQGDKSVAQRNAPPTTQQSPVVPSVVTTNATLSPSPQLQHSPSAVFDQSPVISDILRQIAASNTAVYDLRAQLSDYKSSAAESHSSIQTDLESHRERKRTEDASRNELKSKTRTLEDSKRSAESVKREVEKKLKAAESARTNASERIERLDKEISQLRERMSEDERAIEDLVLHSGEKETEFQKELDLKRKEIKVAEDVVAALNTRAKELEEKIAQEEERLKKAKEQAELKKQDRDFYPLHTVHSQEASPTMSPWSPISATQETLPSQDPHTAIHTDRSEHIEVFPQIFQLPSVIPHVGTRSRGSSGSSSNMGPTEFSTTVSPRPRKLSLGIISNFREHPRAAANPEPPNSSILVNHPTSTQIPIRPPNSYPLFNDTLTGPVPSTRFAPFGDSEIEVPPPGIHDIGAPSPKSTSLIPTSLIQSLEGPTSVEDLSRSFKSDSDDFLDRDWRTGQPYVLNQAGVAVDSPAGFSSSPTSLNHPGFDGIDKEDPFEVRPPPSLSLRHRVSAAESGDLHHPQLFPHPNRTSSEPQPLVRSRTRESDESNVGTAHGTAHKRWFSSSHKDNTKEKKGLNPEAKVFQLKKPSNPTMRTVAPAKYDTLPSMSSHGALPPLNGSTTALPLPPPPAHSAAPGSFMDSFLSTLSMRAFAPSPAEREALTRALGSSTNTSLERLPTLSEVSIASMPSSPSHVHAHTHAHTHAHAHVHGHGHGHHSHTHGAPSSSHAHDVVVGAGRPASSVPSGLAWLHNLPRMRKSKFSPWEDEEPSSSSGNGHAAF